jgi:hypothetical protein
MKKLKLILHVMIFFALMSQSYAIWDLSPESWGHIYCKLTGCEISGQLSVIGNMSASGTISANLVVSDSNVTSVWFNGIYDWIVNTSQSFLNFNGTYLDFDKFLLNDTINDKLDKSNISMKEYVADNYHNKSESGELFINVTGNELDLSGIKSSDNLSLDFGSGNISLIGNLSADYLFAKLLTNEINTLYTGTTAPIQDAIDSVSSSSGNKYIIKISRGLHFGDLLLKDGIVLDCDNPRNTFIIGTLTFNSTGSGTESVQIRKCLIAGNFIVTVLNGSGARAISSENSRFESLTEGLTIYNENASNFVSYGTDKDIIFGSTFTNVFIDSRRSGFDVHTVLNGDSFINHFYGEIDGDVNLSGTTEAFFRGAMTADAIATYNILSPNVSLNMDSNSHSTAFFSNPYNVSVVIEECMDNGVRKEPTISDNGDGTINITGSSVCLEVVEHSRRFSVSGVDNLSLINNSNNFITISLNGGTPIYQSSTLDNSNEETIILVAEIFNDDNILHIVSWDETGRNLANKIHKRIIETNKFERASGIVISESTGRVILISSGIGWLGGVRLTFDDFNSSTDNLTFYYHESGEWIKNDTVTQYNNFNYDDGTDLVELIPGRWTINWFYQDLEGDNVFFVLGSEDYLTLALAQLAQSPSSLPPIISSHSTLIGRILVEKNAATGTIESAFLQVFSPSQVQIHNDLTGKEGGDGTYFGHLGSTIYDKVVNFFTTATVDSGGNLDMGSSNLTANEGTVTNLNVTTDGNIGGNLVVTGNLTVSERIGIGTLNPSVKLHINSSEHSNIILERSQNITTQNAIISFVNPDNFFKWDIGVSGTSSVVGDNDFVIYENGSSALSRFVIKPGGNVGIGTTSTSSKLDVIQSGTDRIAVFNNTDTDANVYIDGIVSEDVSLVLSQNGSNKFLTGYDDSEGGYRIYDFQGTPGTRLFVQNTTGYVGLGTTNPLVKLDLRSNLVSEVVRVLYRNNDSTHYIGFNSGSSTDNSQTIEWKSGDALKFGTTNTPGAGFSEKMRLNGTSGNLGIGNTTPVSKLHVEGNITVSECLVWVNGGGAICLGT